VRRTPRSAIVTAVLSAVVIAGCGESQPAKPVDVSKGADTSQFKGMLEQMKSNVKADKSGKPLLGR
jgi:hypothetical protein